MNLKALIPALVLVATSSLAAAQQSSFYLKDGDRVVFYGDSITDQRLYTTFTETFVVTRFPKMNVNFVHSGWGGDRVGGGGGGRINERLERDVFPYKPTVMTIMLGMNDGRYRAFDQETFDTYSKGYEHIVESVKRTLPGIRLTLIQPSPFDDVTQPPRFEGGYNKVLVRYGDFVKELADKEHCQVADLNGPVVAVLQKAKDKDDEGAKKIVPDRVHPGPAGHLLMAAELLKAWNAPRTVTAVEIDAAGAKVASSSGTQVTGLKGGETLSWEQKDEALPMPVDLKDPVIALVVNCSGFSEALNQQPLKVTGLSKSKYKLSIDGTTVGEFTKDQLSEGVNLAVLATPMTKQAADVHKETIRHNDFHFRRWRTYQVPLNSIKSPRVQNATKELVAALDEEEAELVKQQRAVAQPVSHRYELAPQ